MIRYLELALKTNDDILNFCEQKGLDQLSKVCSVYCALLRLCVQLLSEKAMARKEEDMLSKEELELALALTFQLTKWMLDKEAPDNLQKQVGRVMQGWDSKV